MTVQAIWQAYPDIDRLDLELFVAHVLGRTRAWLHAHSDHTLSECEVAAITAMVERRRQHEPVAYILQSKEFCGRQFFVNSSVLVPRPATESLVQLALDFVRKGTDEERSADTGISVLSRRFRPFTDNVMVADVGTGSGCIAVTLAAERSDLHVLAIDISEAALAVAHVNTHRHGVSDRVQFLQGDCLDPLVDWTEPFIVVSNPPYIPEHEELMPDVGLFEPKNALFAGANGLAVIEPLVQAAKAHPHCYGIVLECRADQVGKLQL